jgi:crotonobetainyl-CoA:carnitine CoA-transferase CaiB-like acyl-CoA transferase
MKSQLHRPLDDVLVVERAGRLAGGVCAMLLLQLGATVVRCEAPGEPLPLALKGQAAANLAAFLRAGRERVVYEPESFARLLERADVAIAAPLGTSLPPEVEQIRAQRERLVACIITPYGLEGAPDDVPAEGDELSIQALAGLMDTTGEQGGPPLPNGVPVAELAAGINAAAGVMAALRIRESGGQVVEACLFDSLIAMMGTFMPLVVAGHTASFRQGCRHPLTAPWNVYPTADGRVIVCTSTDEHWRRILALAGRPELARDERFATPGKRVQHVEAVDAVVGGWSQGLPTRQVTDELTRAGVPVGGVLTIPGLLRDEGFRARGMVREVRDETGTLRTLAGPLVHSTRGEPFFPEQVEPLWERVREERLPPAWPRRPAAAQRAAAPAQARPLDGIRVVEAGFFTAGPMAARNLASLGAEVIKVEALDGEPARRWDPTFDGIGHYFINCNCDKRSLAVDLKTEPGRRIFMALVGRADVVVENMRPGSLDKLGLGYEPLSRENPGLIYYSLSGYGRQGANATKAAFDTVIQAESGLMSLLNPGVPVKMGVSVADLMGATYAPVAILGALRQRERDGRGQFIDVSMQDCTGWLTQFSWPDGEPSLPPWQRIEGADGYVLVCAGPERVQPLLAGLAPRAPCAGLVTRLRAAGLPAVRIRELREVLEGDLVRGRGLLVERPNRKGHPVKVLAPAYRLGRTPARIESLIGEAGADTEEILGELGYAAADIANLREAAVVR